MSVIVDPSGKYVYVAKYGDGRSNNGTVSAYSITTSGSTSGALTPIGNAVTAGTGPRSIVTVRIAQ
jgi:DNA-binding beta-propeller fold protein YncE